MTRSTPAFEHLLVGVEPVEGRLRRDLDLLGELAVVCSSGSDLNAWAAPSAWFLKTSPTATISTFGSVPLMLALGLQDVADGAGAAAAAADQPDLDRLVAGGERAGARTTAAATPAAADVFRKSRRSIRTWESSWRGVRFA